MIYYGRLLFTRVGRALIVVVILATLAGDYFLPVGLRVALDAVLAVLVLRAVFKIQEATDDAEKL